MQRERSGSFIWRRWRIGVAACLPEEDAADGASQDIDLAAKRLREWKAQQ
jgi:hypothetical protein